MPKHNPLPVAGYTTQSEANVAIVNQNKRLEEQVLRQIDLHAATEGLDQRMVAMARTKTQEAFMWLNRAVFQPQRLQGDL